MGQKQAKEQLLHAIETDRVKEAIAVIEKFPEFLNETLSGSQSATPLQRAAWRGSMDMTLTLIEIGADLDKPDNQGITPLMWAAKRDHADVCITLIRSDANFKRRSFEGLSALDYAVLHGNYNSAYIIFEFDKLIQNQNSYQIIQKMKNWRWVNYDQIVKSLQGSVSPHNTLDFFIVPPKMELNDPVIDPRETWSQMIGRIINFGEPPLVERQSLPRELQPQHRVLGRLRSYINGMDSKQNQNHIQDTNIDKLDHQQITEV